MRKIVGILLIAIVMAVGCRAEPPYDPSGDKGTLLEGFEDKTEWTLGGIGSHEDDPGRVKQGSQSMRLTTSESVADAPITKNVSWNLGHADRFSVWVHVANVSEVSRVALAFSSDAHFATRLSVIPVWRWHLNDGWNHIVFTKEELVRVGGGVDWSNIIRFRVAARAVGNATTSVSWDSLRYNQNQGARIIITFDDGFKSDITKAYPILKANNQTATTFITTNWIGRPGHLNVTDLHILYEAGWDISNHAVTHRDLTTLSLEELHKEVNDAYDWLVNHGFGRTAGLFAAPFGAQNPTVVGVIRQRHALARAGGGGRFRGHVELDGLSEYWVRAEASVNTTTSQDLYALVDGAIAKQSVLVLLLHRIVDSNPLGVDTLTSVFRDFSNYVTAKEDAGLLRVITLSEYYAEMLGTKPTVATGRPTTVDERTVMLANSLLCLGTDPISWVWFEWGYDTALGNTVGLNSANTAGSFSYTLTGLAPGRTIYYRFVGRNTPGASYGDIE